MGRLSSMRTSVSSWRKADSFPPVGSRPLGRAPSAEEVPAVTQVRGRPMGRASPCVPIGPVRGMAATRGILGGDFQSRKARTIEKQIYFNLVEGHHGDTAAAQEAV